MPGFAPDSAQFAAPAFSVDAPKPSIKTLTWGKSPAGTAGTAIKAAKLTLTAKGSNGKALTGTYPAPITLANSDKSGATTLLINGKPASKKNLVTKSTDKITLKYTGLAIAPVTFTASSKGVKKPAKAAFAPKLAAIVYTGSLVSNAPEIDLPNATGGTTATFTATQAGWTGSPFNKAFTQAFAAVSGFTNNCATAYTITPASGAAGTSFTVSIVANAPAGECLLTLGGGAGQTKSVLLTYATTGVVINGTRAPNR